MKKIKKGLLACISLLLLVSILGCWDYTEIEDRAVVAGIGIDKDSDGKLLATVEIVDTKEGMKSSQAGYKMVSLSGKTLFEIVRGMISITGKKLFWSHSKAIIISEEVAKEGVVKVIDWYNRDTETRSDVYVFVSKEKTAQEVINLNSSTETIMSYGLAQQMAIEQNVSTAPVVEIWDFIEKLETPGDCAIAPLIYIHEKNGQKNPRVSGTAIFKMDKMIGKLSGEETKYMLFVKDNIKGGVLTVNNEEGTPDFTLEIFSNKTKVKPVWVNGKLRLQINTFTHTGLDEVMTTEGFTSLNSKNVIEKRAAKELQKNILSVVKKVQQDYHSDIFGFGEIIFENMPKTWTELDKDWEREFSDLEVVVNSTVIIESSAQNSRSIQIHQE
ncbi:Ger(x)C family spore germination protein [Paenibacillus nitricinens]|uniref:Ger(x)C family spore germination protein n=1 Tax=Paenibacillus nitricinens TaxID=3367691 RepID=UPI003F84D5EE